ncbi:MAG: hypothetical protein JRI65_10110 [Deltaproteobacteria bacterium]|nr:hypothetical protein [Deltaproteobacteria bacterium]
MSETRSHQQAKRNAPGKTEVHISRNRRLDSATPKTATEIQRNPSGIPKAVSRLRDSGRSRRVLQVPQQYMKKAVAEMRRQNVSGTVKNLGGTKRQSISKKR